MVLLIAHKCLPFLRGGLENRGDMEGTTVASLARRHTILLSLDDFALRVRGSNAELPIGRDWLKGLRASLHIYCTVF